MNYAEIKPCDIANGEGVRVSLFVSGCLNHCAGCFNEDAQSFEYGQPYTEDTEADILKAVSPLYIAGLSLLGGDPLWQSPDDIMQLRQLCDKVHEMGKTVWLWSGFIWEELLLKTQMRNPCSTDLERWLLVADCDVFVDGPFVQNAQNLALPWRGSSNQRVIDVKQSLFNGGRVSLWLNGEAKIP